MNKLLIVTCAAAVALVGAAVASPTGEDKAVQVKDNEAEEDYRVRIKQCIDALASNVERIPESVAEFVKEAEAKFPQDEYNWWELEEHDTQEMAAIYPQKGCDEYLNYMMSLSKRTFQGNLEFCSDLGGEHEAVEMAEANPILKPILLASRTCVSFQPYYAATVDLSEFE